MIDVKIDLNKSLNSFSNRIKVRQGDVGEKMRITLTDNKFSLENQNNLQVKFEGNIRSGDYVEGIAFPYNDKAGEFVYQFKSEDVSIPGAYQRAFIRVYDESGNRISSEDIFVEVLKDADISNNQSKIYVSKLDELLEDFDDDFGEFLTGKEEDYSALDEKSKELNSELSDLKKGSNEIKNTQTEIIQSIEDNDLATKNDLETAKQESSANVIDQVIGKVSNENKVIIDLKGKIVGSAVENPNDAKVTHTQTLLNPNSTDFFTLSQQAYDQQKDLDGVVLTVSNSLNGRFRQNVYSWDILTVTKKIVGDAFFEGLNADTVAKQVAILKKMVNVKTAVWGFGSNYSGNKLSLKIWGNDTSWIGEANHTEATISKLEYDSTLNTNSFISEDGFVYVTAFSEPSDGNTASSLSVDYANLELEFNLSVHEYINNMIAANHGEKIATQEEAEAGTDNTKTMTPLRTAQQLEKKAVTIAGNQTIGGIKNFKDGLMINDVSLSTITRKVIYEADGVGGYFNAADKFTLGASGKIDKIVLLWSRVDDTAGTLLNYSWSQTVLSPDDLVVGNSYRIQMTTDNYKFVTFANESGNVTISGANENSVAPNRIYRIKRIIAYLKN